MEYWEFLIQKEGDRSWQPIKSPKIELEANRYRVVAHSSRSNTDVEVCVTHETTEEVPPKRRSQKRSRRTNQEGLMVVIPFTYLKPGRWELRCSGDIMADFLGKSWQHSVQIQVLPKTIDVLPIDEPTKSFVESTQKDTQADISQPVPSTANADLTVEPTQTETQTPPVTPLAETAEIPENQDVGLDPHEPSTPQEDENLSSPISSSQSSVPIFNLGIGDEESALRQGENIQSESETNQQGDRSLLAKVDRLEEATLSPHPPNPEVPRLEDNEAEPLAATLADSLVSLELTDVEPNKNTPHNGNLAKISTPTNAILEQSLQMLEEVLQQVLDPVLQDFERPEPQEADSLETPDPEPPLEIDTNQPKLNLTLDADALVARRGEPLTISGRVDNLDENHFSGETNRDANELFQGTLHYELRDPQTSQVLLNVQQALSEQTLPFTFSHTLEIPPDCQTRLFLGNVTLYGSTSDNRASQPFSVTADLDELLGSIIPGTRVMPMAKMLVLANNPTALQGLPEEPPEVALPPLDGALLDLVDPPEGRQPLTLQPSPSQPLPPQIYQAPTTHRLSKSPQLPKLPRVRSITTSPEIFADESKPDQVEVKQEETVVQPLALLNASSPETPPQELTDTTKDTSIELLLQEVQEAAEAWEDATSQEDGATVVDSSSQDLDAIAWSEPSLPDVDFELSNSQATEMPEVLETTADEQQVTSTLDTAQTPESEQAKADSIWDTPDFFDQLVTDTPEANSQFSDSDATQLQEGSELERQSTEVPVTQPVTEEPAVIDNAFQALNIQDRFWSRLNSLATDAELSQWLRSEIYPSSNLASVEEEVTELPNSEPEPEVPEVEEVTEQQDPDTLLAEFDESIWADESIWVEESEEVASLQSPPLEESSEESIAEEQPVQERVKPHWVAQEFVVDDEDQPAPEPSVKRAAPEPSVKRSDAPEKVELGGQLTRQPEPRTLSSRKVELPVPAPTICLPASELPAGETVTIRVQLPPHPARLCVKLWVQDRQTRSLLDGPRWLMDLIPDRAGELEALTQVIIPFGSAEIRFEAIAVDIDSQRESHKVMVDCVVIPPDLPNFSLDEFGS